MRFAALCLACALAPVGAMAGTFTAAPQSTYLVDLDTPDQHMSEWRVDDIGSDNALRATVKVNGLIETTGKIKPGFLMQFVAGDDKASLYFAGAPSAKTFAANLSAERGGKDLGGGGLFLTSAVIGVGKPFDLAVDWTPDGKLTVTIDGHESQTVQLAHAPSRIEIDGTAGEIELNPMSLGHTAP